jgi:gliding motility-associated-like protein
MRNLLLLFINILVFSSISFSQNISFFPNSQYVCQGGSVTFGFNGPAVPAGSTYDWSFAGAGPSIANSTSPTPLVSFAGSGSLSGLCNITLTINQGTLNELFYTTKVQVLASSPTVTENPGNPTTFCVGTPTSILYTVTGGGCPTLSGGNGLAVSCNSNSVAGFIIGYNVTISGTPTTAGCLGSLTSQPLGSCPGSTPAVFSLSQKCINKKPTVTSISYSSPSFCTTAGLQSVSLNGSNGTIYSGSSSSVWPFNSGVYSAPTGLSINASTGEITPSSSTPGTYLVTFTIAAANGCTLVTSTTSVIITGLPTANLSYPLSPWCNSITSQQLPSLNGTNGYQPGIYSSPTLSSINASTGAIIPSTNPTGPHTVTYTTLALGGCPAVSTNTTVTINPIPIASADAITSTTNCSGINAELELYSNIGFNYQWLLNNNPATEPGNSGVISTGFETYSVSLPGNYTLRVTDPITNCFSTTTDLLTIVVLPLPSIVVSASPRFLCLGQSTILSGPTGPSISFVDWYDSNDGLIGIGSPYTWAYAASSDVIYAEIMGSNGCSANSSTISIGVMPLPPVPSIVNSLPSSGTECSPNCVTLFSNTLPLPNMSYSWSSGGGNAINASYCSTGNYNVTHSIIYSNSAFTPSTLTCTNTSIDQLVTIDPAPTTPTITATGGLTSTTFCSGSSITLSVPNLPNTDFEWSNGSFISSITVNSPGSYSVRIRNTITGCWSNYATYTVTMIPLPIPIILSPPSPVCLAAGGSVTLSSNYPAGNSWSGCGASSSTSSLNVSVSCLYTLTVTQAGCSASTSLNLTINPRPSAVITQSGSLNICTGSCVTLSAVNSPNTLYAWYTTSASGPPIGTNYNYVACSPGTYYVVITDNTTGCSSTSINYTVTTLTSPLNTITIQVPGTNTFCQGGSATLQGPTAPIGTTYTYQWYNTSGPLGIGINQNATSSGTYYCIITNSNTLCSIQSNSILITVNPNPTAIINPTTNLCVGAVLTASGIPSSPLYQYQWFLGGLPVLGPQNNTYSATSAGNVYVRLTDPNGCIANSSTVSINALPTTPVISGITPFCAGTSTTLSTPLVANCTYTWSPVGGTVGATQNIYTVSAGGTYSVTITNSNGCSSTSLTYPVIMTPTPITPTISPAGPISLCVGQTQILTSTSPSGAGTNLWNGGTPTNLLATTISNSISGSGSYTYTVTINGCSATSAPVIVTFNPNPSIPTLTSSAQTLCAYPTSNVLLTSSPAAPGIAYSWNGGTTPGNNQTNSITPSSNGTGAYFVTHTNTTTGCSSISNSIPVTFNPLPSITITPNGPTNYCQSGTVTLNSAVVPALPNPPYAYSWTGSPAALTSTTSAANLTFLSTSLAGTYTYTLQATNPTTGCVGFSLPQTIQINPNPIATITPSGSTTFCQGSNVILTAGPTGNSYVWSGSPFNGSTLSAITVSTTGTYGVTVTNSFGCVNTSPTQTVAVTANPITPIITSPITTAICSGNSLILTFNNPTNNTTHRWYETSIGLVQIGGATYSATSSGTYYLVTTSTLSPLCSSSSNLITVTVNANPSTPIISSNIATPICQGNSVTLSAGSYDPNLTYTWTPSSSNAGGSLTDDNINNVTATGSYVVTVSNSNGCNALSLPYTVNVNPLPIVPIVIASGPTSFCAGASVNLIVSNQVVGHIYDWYLSGGNAPVFTGTTYTIINSGIYYVKARNPITLCESNSSTTPITVNPLPTAAITPAGPITVCDGDLLTLTAFNSPGYSFSWGISNTNVISSSGIYNVTVTLNGCSAISNSVTVNYISNPSPIIISSPVSLEACFGGSVNLSVGGIFPLTACTYEWFNSAGILVQGPGTNSSYIATSSGTYRVKATSTLGTFCSSFSAPVTVTIHPNIPVSIIIPPNSSTSFCEGTSSITLTADPLIGYTYVWSNGLTSPTINLSLTSQSGPYTVTVTNSVTNCSATSPIIPISIYPNPSAPSISPIGPLNSCAGNPLLTLTASPSTFPTYQWKNGNVNVGSNSPSHNPASTGTYSVIATNSNGCSSLPSNSTSITIVPIPATPVIIPQTGSPLQFCQGLSINLSATINSGSTYQWFRNGIPYISGNPVNITLSGTYTLIETNSLGCSSQTSSPLTIIVYPNPTPVITALSTTEFCADPGASVTLQATPGSNLYQWTCVSPNLLTQAPSSSPNFIATQSGTYSVTTTTSNNCISAVSNSITVVVNPLPVATITPGSATSFCADPGAFVTLTAGPSGNIYQWSTSGPALGNPSLASQNITQTGMYSVLVTNPITNCENTASLPVTVNPLPTPSIIASGITTPLCDGQSVVLTADPTGSGLTYIWSPSSFTSIATPPITSSGTYSVKITDANGCSATSAPVPVVFNSNPIAFITPSSLPTFCQGETITLQSNPMSDNYVWSQQLSPGVYTIIASGIPSIPVSQSGIYTVTNYNPSGCFTTSNPITVTVNPLPTPLITAIGAGIPGNTEVCQGNSVFLSVSGIGITSYQWRVNGVNIPGANSINYPATSSGFYSVEVGNNNNCFKISSEVEVTINPNPTAEINYLNSPDPILLCPGGTIGLTAAPSSMYYSWNSPNLGFETNQFVLATTSGTYEVIVTDPATGCFDTSDPVNVTIQTLGTTSAAVIGMPSTLTLCPGSLFTLSGITTPNASSFNWTLISAPAGCNLIGASTLNPTFTSGTVSGTAILRLNTSLNYPCNTVPSYQDITINISPSIPTLSNNINSGLVDQVLCSNIPIDPIIFNVLDILGSGTTIPSVTIDGTTVLASTPYNGISWNFIGGQVVISGTPNFGTYTYTVNGIPTGSPSCLLTSLSGTITSQAPSLSIFSGQFTNNQIICIGTSIAPIIYDYTGIISSIDLPDGVFAQSNTSGNQYTISGTPLAVGYYNYVITTETVCGFETLLGEITVIPPITGNTSGTATTTNCDGSEFTLIGGILNSSANTNYTYLWVYSTSITGPYDPAPGINTNANYEGTIYLANDTLYFRRFVYAGDCYDYAAPVMVHVIPLGTNPNMIAFAGADQTISLGQSVELVTTGVNISEYNWSPTIGLSSATISNPFASPVSTTIYTLTVQDIYGCSYSDDITVTVLNDYSLTIPSLITPNDDGSNDFWEIPESLFYTGTTVKIINREGQEVYSSSNYDNTWDGTFNGKLLPEATYYYFIQFPNSEITHKGPVTILRNIK